MIVFYETPFCEMETEASRAILVEIREIVAGARCHIITDPPYDVFYKKKPKMSHSSKVPKKTSPPPLHMYRYDFEHPQHHFGDLSFGNQIFFSPLKNLINEADEHHVWTKQRSTKNVAKNCGNFVEAISIFRNPSCSFNPDNLHWSQCSNIHDDRLIEKQVHPFEKPMTLMERLVRLYTSRTDFVIDPFAGSGTTLVAACEHGRNAIGFELDKEHAKAARERFSDHGYRINLITDKGGEIWA